jgi:hypothetical protein
MHTPLTSQSQTSTGEETRNDSVPRILLLAVPFHRTVKRREQPAPNAKVASEDWCTGFDRGEGTDKAFSLFGESASETDNDDGDEGDEGDKSTDG